MSLLVSVNVPPQLCHVSLRGFGSQPMGSEEPLEGILTESTDSRSCGDVTHKEDYELICSWIQVTQLDIPEITRGNFDRRLEKSFSIKIRC